MAKTREQKEVQLAELQKLVAQPAIVFTQYGGLSVKDLDELRSQLRAAGCQYMVPKISLLNKALKDQGIDIPEGSLKVQLGIATSVSDEVEPNRVTVAFAKTHEKLGILGAVINGQYFDAAYVRTLAALPGKQELYAKVVGSIGAPLSGLVNVLGGNLRGLVSVLHQYEEKLAGQQ